MRVKSKFSLKGVGRDSYLELVMAFPLASIKSQEQLQQAQEVMDQLLARSELDDGQEMYLDALSDLVAAYEDEHHAIEPASDADMLRHLMEANTTALNSALFFSPGFPKLVCSQRLGRTWHGCRQNPPIAAGVAPLLGSV
jgi:HTH-type transcriptional regulator / antitoxin HigA